MIHVARIIGFVMALRPLLWDLFKSPKIILSYRKILPMEFTVLDTILYCSCLEKTNGTLFTIDLTIPRELRWATLLDITAKCVWTNCSLVQMGKFFQSYRAIKMGLLPKEVTGKFYFNPQLKVIDRFKYFLNGCLFNICQAVHRYIVVWT
ncbi:hypothetical protein D3C81_1280510 [compost metagenome]